MTPRVPDSVIRPARWLRRGLLLAMLLLVVVNAWVWLQGKGSAGTGWIAVTSTWPARYDVHAWTAMVAMSLASLALLWGFWRLRRMMGLFMAGDFFSIGATRCLRDFARALVLAVLVDVLVAPLLLLLAVWLTGAPDGTQLTLGLDATDLAALLVATLLWMVTAIMAEARRLAEDNAQII